MSREVLKSIVAGLLIVAGFIHGEIAFAQQSLLGIRLQDGFSHVLTINGPPGGFTSSYNWRFPSAVSGTGSLLYTSNAAGQLDWITPSTNGYILSLSGSIPTWSDPAAILGNSYWSLSGNSLSNAYNGTTGSFIGTTNTRPLVLATTNTSTAQPIEFFTNNVETMRLSPAGELGIGLTPTSGKLLHVTGTAGTSNVRLASLASATGTTGRVMFATDATGDLQTLDVPLSSGQVLSSTTAGLLSWISASTGTVTSVGLSMPSIFTVSNSPVTTSGTLTATLATQTQNQVFASPDGSSGAPTFRAITANDLPGSFGGFANPSGTVGLSAVNGTATTALRSDAAPALSQAIAPTWTAKHIFNQTIGATSTDGIVLQNTTAVAAGAQQWSPRLHFTGQGWKTTATAGSQSTDWIIENQPVQGAANPSSNLVFSSSINASAYTARATLTSAGVLTLGSALGVGSGGTGLATFGAVGAIPYASAATTLVALAGNTTATKKFLTQTGNGAASAAPAWNTIVAGDMPIFIASGVSHATGAVPDPGAVAGTTKFLREDATWQLVSGTLSGLTTNGAMYATGATSAASTAAMTDGQLLIGSTAGNPVLGTLTGTASRLSVTNSGGSITLNIDPNYVGQNTITTVGTIGTGTWNAGAVTSSGAVIGTTLGPTTNSSGAPTANKLYKDNIVNAWGNIPAAGTTATASFGIASYTHAANGTYVITLNNAIATANHGSISVTIGDASTATAVGFADAQWSSTSTITVHTWTFSWGANFPASGPALADHAFFIQVIQGQ